MLRWINERPQADAAHRLRHVGMRLNQHAASRLDPRGNSS
jgi:hypothetical protein